MPEDNAIDCESVPENRVRKEGAHKKRKSNGGESPAECPEVVAKPKPKRAKLNNKINQQYPCIQLKRTKVCRLSLSCMNSVGTEQRGGIR